MSEGHGTPLITADRVAHFTQYVRLVSSDAAKNRQRFYLFSWQPMLDGERALACTWGRLGTVGRSRVLIFPTGSSIELHLERLIQRRLKRGYDVTEWC